ncbi:phage tail tube assembly chaperone [Lacticaseibacillus mingshuiensis]|uniref:Phage tail tube assembly chaperone n=1 Tax=Lacticaseibacillus mingshuiensis TaxID=2799574 RepID=A0ABW4CF20_9LACO|nr:phage tail tube assembly chaperone [Lacticaseibacillus mingshuiensis]
MKIKEAKLSNREHIVKVTNRVMKATLALQLMMAEIDDVEDADLTPVEQLKQQQKLIDDVMNYITDTLKLNEKEQEKLDDLEFSETVEIANNVILRVQGLSDEDIAKLTKEAEEAEQADDKSEAKQA